MSRNTISEIYRAADEKKLYWIEAQYMDEKEIQDHLFGDHGVDLVYQIPDFDMIHKELLKPGVTLQLLYDEYADSCRKQSKPFYQKSNFYRLYSEHVKKIKLTMHIHHKPGDRMMVDWDGKSTQITDR